MFTLRTVFDTQKERNNFLGNDFEVFFKDGEEKEDEFNYYFDKLFPNPERNDKENVFAIVNNGEKIIPLYKHFSYYVVTEKGKTFSNLTFKKES